MIDFFANAYGWSKSQIDEMYPEEAMKLIDKVFERQRAEKSDQMLGWLFTVASGFNPQEKWIETLTGGIQKLSSNSSDEARTSSKPYWEVTELDRDGLNRVKKELQKVKESRTG